MESPLRVPSHRGLLISLIIKMKWKAEKRVALHLHVHLPHWCSYLLRLPFAGPLSLSPSLTRQINCDIYILTTARRTSGHRERRRVEGEVGVGVGVGVSFGRGRVDSPLVDAPMASAFIFISAAAAPCRQKKKKRHHPRMRRWLAPAPAPRDRGWRGPRRARALRRQQAQLPP